MSRNLNNPFYRVKDIVALGVAQRTAYHWVSTGQIKSERIGGTIVIPPAEYARLQRLVRPAAA